MSAARSLRVAFVQRTFAVGGAERVAVEQIRALAAVPSVIDVWLTDDRRRDLEPAAREAHPGLHRVGVATSVASLAARLLRGRYDLIVTCGTRKGLRAARSIDRLPFSRRPAVLATVHTHYADHVERLASWAGEIDAFALIYDFSDRLADALGAARSRIVVTMPTFAPDLPEIDADTRCSAAELRASWGATERSVVLGTFGRIAANKGIVPLIRMADRLAVSGRDVHLVVAGGPPPGAPPASPYAAEVDAAIASALALRGRVHRLGGAARSLAMYRAFDVFALLGRHEGLPLVLREAMLSGTPVLASAIGGIAATFRDGLDAALVAKDVDDGTEWTAADLARFEARLAALADDGGERRRLGAVGRESALAGIASNDFAAAFRRSASIALEARRETAAEVRLAEPTAARVASAP